MHLNDQPFKIGLRFIILMIFLISGEIAFSQYYSTGQEPASIRWRKIKTDHVKLIFPDYYEKNARWLAAYIDSVSTHASLTLNYKPKRIPLILHTQTANSNALVAWAPKRMEFYTTPPQDMYAQPWLAQLSLHEYRHVVQTEKINQGLTKVISWLFGEQGTGAILGLYLPLWFLEGDAVAAETGLSRSGRGRVPLFEMNMRTLVLESGPYTYDKASMGSYRDFIPGNYELGYLLVTEGRRNHGTELWEHTLNRVGKRPYMVTPFQKGIKDITGKRKVPFYEECLSGLEARWKIQDKFTKTQLKGSPLNKWNKHYTDYRHPVFINDSTTLAMKISLNDITRFVVIDNDGNEEIIFTPGFLKRETLSYAAGKICWLETKPDPRWAHRSYTVIRILDAKSKKTTSIKHKLKLFAPALSPDASSIVAVKTDSLNRYSLVILDAGNGVIARKIDIPGNAFPMTPVWAGNDMILAVIVSEEGKNIASFDISSGSSETLLDWGYTDISQPIFHAPHIYFTAGYSGISNIYALDVNDGDIFRVSSARFGAVDASISEDGKTMMYADYTSEGFRIMRLPFEISDWIPLDKIQDRSIQLYTTLATQEKLMPPGSEIPPSEAPAKKYSKIANLFNFHSWAPLDINASTYTVSPGVSVSSQNLLSSSLLSAGYSYDINEQAGKIYGLYTYSGWYPIIDLSVDYGLRKDFAYVPEKTEVKWNETNLKAALRLPLDFRRGKYFAGIQLSTYANQGFRRMKEGIALRFKKPDIFSMGYGFYAYRQIKKNFRDIFPRWGQSLGLYYRNTPFQGGDMSYIAAATLSLYFPGIVRHQGLNVYAGFQRREITYYKFSDIVSYPRGITGKQDEELLSIKGTYAFPIAYPDWSIGPVIYMKRIRANLFFDYAIGWNPGKENYYSSLGADLLTEIHILRFIAPFEMGVRSAYLPEEDSFYWSFLFSVGFSSFYVSDRPSQSNPAF